MLIETKYEIGQKIWIAYKNKGEVCLYCEAIEEIAFEKEGFFYMTEHSFDEIQEKDVILENDKDKLFEAIQKIMKEIDEEEGGNKGNGY